MCPYRSDRHICEATTTGWLKWFHSDCFRFQGSSYYIFLSGGEVSRVTLAGVFRVENTESERNGLCTYYYSGSDEFWSWVQCREEQPPERSHFLMRESDNNAFQKKIHITRQHCPQYLISRWHDWRDVQPQLAERLGLGAQKGQYFARKLRRGRQDRRNVMDIKLPFQWLLGKPSCVILQVNLLPIVNGDMTGVKTTCMRDLPARDIRNDREPSVLNLASGGGEF